MSMVVAVAVTMLVVMSLLRRHIVELWEVGAYDRGDDCNTDPDH